MVYIIPSNKDTKKDQMGNRMTNVGKWQKNVDKIQLVLLLQECKR